MGAKLHGYEVDRPVRAGYLGDEKGERQMDKEIQKNIMQKEIEEKIILTDVPSQDALCRKTKEIKEIKVTNLEDMKEVARLLESKNWVAIYATTNVSNVIIVLSRI